MDSRDIVVFKQILQNLRDNERVVGCKIPKIGDWQTIFTLRGVIMSEPKFSCFRALATNGDEFVCIIRIDNAGRPNLGTSTEKLLRLTLKLAESICLASSSKNTSSTGKRYAVDGGVTDVLLKMEPAYQSCIPPPKNRSIRCTLSYPIALCRDAIEEWMQSNSSVVIIYGAGNCGKSKQIVHYILQHCHTRSQNCRAVCVLQDGVQVLSTAWRISDERKETMGNTIGCKMRTHTRLGDCTNVAFYTDEVMLVSLLSKMSQQAFGELTHLIIGNVGRRKASVDFLLSLLKEKHQLHPTLKLILLTESTDVDTLARFFHQSKLIVVPEVGAPGLGTNMAKPFVVEYIFLDSILTHISTCREMLEIRRKISTGPPLKLMAEIQGRYGYRNCSYYLSCHMDALLERCFYARDPGGFSALLGVLENHKHLVDYQHTESKLTSLMIAAAKGFSGVVQILLQLGANPFVEGKKRLTALDWCISTHTNSCLQLMVDVCQSYSEGGKPAANRGRLFSQLYHRIHNPYVVDHFLVLDIVMFITAKRSTGKILVMLPDFTDVLHCYAILRESAPAKANRMVFMIHHRYVTEEEVQMTRYFPRYPHFLVILMGGPLLEMLPSLSSIDYLIDTGLRVEKMYNPVKEAYLNRMCYNTKQTVSSLKLLPKQACFFLYTKDQLDSMPAYEKPNRNCFGLPMQVLQALISRDRLSTSVEMFFDAALTPPAPTNVSRSIEILTQMGAIEQPLRVPTNLGIMLAHLCIDVHHGKALLYSFLFQCLDPVLTIVATLYVGNPFKEPLDEESAVNIRRTKTAFSQRAYSDFLVLLRLYQQWGVCKHKFDDVLTKYGLKKGAMDAITNKRLELMTVLRSHGLVKCGLTNNNDELNKHSNDWIRVKACLTVGFYPNLAKFDYEKRSFRDFCCTDAPLELHPLSVVNLDELPTKWVIYDHKEDFMLEVQDHSTDDLPVHMVVNTPISDYMVMLLCDIDENLPTNNPTGEAEATTSGPYLRPLVPKIDESRHDDNNKELLIGRRYTFQLSPDCYNAVVWLRQQIGHMFREFTSNPLHTLARTDVRRILTHVTSILQEEENNVSPSMLTGIGARPKVKSQCLMGVGWN